MLDQDKETDNQFRVLSLDGGGVRGILPARILANIEAYLNNRSKKEIPLGHRFDFVVGTSTGGLIALGLAAGLSAKEILQFYEKYIPEIFGEKNKNKWFKQIIKPRYKQDALKSALVELFGDKTLGDVSTDVCITSVALGNAKPRFHKSGYLARNRARLGEKLVDIALATSAAPVYFPSHTTELSGHLIDGGMCANNPVMVALVEAMQFEETSKRGTPPPQDSKKRDLGDIVMLSLGTGELCAMPYRTEKLKSGGIANWAVQRDSNRPLLPLPSPAFPMIEILMQSQSDIAHSQASILLGSQCYLRVNPQLKFPMALDDAHRIEELRDLGDLDSEIERFLNTHY